MRPLQNIPFCPIIASGSNFNPRNIQYIPPVEIFAFLVVLINWPFLKNNQGHILFVPANRPCHSLHDPVGNKIAVNNMKGEKQHDTTGSANGI
jgi:hypothetical protein